MNYRPSWLPLYALIIIGGCGLLLAMPLKSDDAQQDKQRVDIQFENWQMSLLTNTQKREGVTINPFTTDGCSGGMSESWQYIANTFPAFEQRYGDQPPWQACCVEHDKAYWRGETENGYQKRLLADTRLEQCVIEFGQQHSQEYAEKYNLEKITIETHFSIAAKLMYGAVRIGGKPCSFLPWRWGYGWPHCLPNRANSGE